MNKKIIVIVFSIIMIIAYVDLVDCFRHFEKVMSQSIKLDADIKTKIDTTARNPIKTQK